MGARVARKQWAFCYLVYVPSGINEPEVVTTPIRGCRYMCLVLTYYKCADVNDIENDTQKQKHKNTFSNDVLMLLYKLIYP